MSWHTELVIGLDGPGKIRRLSIWRDDEAPKPPSLKVKPKGKHKVKGKSK